MTRHRLIPYKILILLLYADVSPITHLDKTADGVRLAIGTGGFARLLRVSNSRLHDHLEWLASYSYIDIESRERGKIVVVVRTPSQLRCYVRHPTITEGAT